jgi:hypothetical protein
MGMEKKMFVIESEDELQGTPVYYKFINGKRMYTTQPDQYSIKVIRRRVKNMETDKEFCLDMTEKQNERFMALEPQLGVKYVMEKNGAKTTFSIFMTEQDKEIEGLKDIVVPDTISLNDVSDYFYAKGVVGEEKNKRAILLAILARKCVGLEGMSGSGKSYQADAILKLFPKSFIYEMGLQSNLANWYDREEINKAHILYITELQKAANNLELIETLKNIGEGKPITRKVTNKQRNGVDELTIDSKDKIFFYTLAFENKAEVDTELGRRRLEFITDISNEQTRTILEDKIKRRYFGIDKKILDPKVIKKHILDVWNLKAKTIIPYGQSIIEKIPPKILARTYTDHLLDLIEACAKFNYKNRITDNGVIYADIEDLKIVMDCYGEQFVKSIYNIPIGGDLVLNKMKDLENSGKANVTPNELQNYIMDVDLAGANLKEVLKKLEIAGFISENPDKTYSLISTLDSKITFAEEDLAKSSKEFFDGKKELMERWFTKNNIKVDNYVRSDIK